MTSIQTEKRLHVHYLLNKDTKKKSTNKKFFFCYFTINLIQFASDRIGGFAQNTDGTRGRIVLGQQVFHREY